MSAIVEKNVLMYFPLCNNCKHRLDAGFCQAFPGGIPKDILTGRHDHNEAYPGDNGIRFEPIEVEPVKE